MTFVSVNLSYTYLLKEDEKADFHLLPFPQLKLDYSALIQRFWGKRDSSI